MKKKNMIFVFSSVIIALFFIYSTACGKMETFAYARYTITQEEWDAVSVQETYGENYKSTEIHDIGTTQTYIYAGNILWNDDTLSPEYIVFNDSALTITYYNNSSDGYKYDVSSYSTEESYKKQKALDFQAYGGVSKNNPLIGGECLFKFADFEYDEMKHAYINKGNIVLEYLGYTIVYSKVVFYFEDGKMIRLDTSSYLQQDEEQIYNSIITIKYGGQSIKLPENATQR